jgi:hypothetical protein
MVPLVLVLLLSLGALPAASRAQEITPQSAASPEALEASVYPLLSYQGRLVESGVAANGYRDMTFRLWTASPGGTKVWEEGPLKVWVSDGLFTATLGEAPALPVDRFADELWIEVQIGATTLPRQRLMGSPYAMSLAPGARVRGSKTAGDPAIVTLENTGTGSALGAASAGNGPTLQLANTSNTGPAAQIDSNGSDYTAMIANGYPGASSAGGVLRLMTNGGRVLLVQNKSFTQLFSVEANGDVTQNPAAGGLVKFAVSAQCANDDSAIQRYYTHGKIPTIADGDSEGRCTIDPGFDPSARYWTVTAPASGSIRLASCAVSDGKLQCTRTDVDGAGVNGPIQVLIY